jgi:hypothetical protein
MSVGFVEFEFDPPEALLAGLTSKLTKMEGAPLVPANVEDIPEFQGVYMLLHRGILAYIGKTVAEAGLRKKVAAPCADNPAPPKSSGRGRDFQSG